MKTIHTLTLINALPDQLQMAWWIAAGLTFLLAVAVLLPTIWFG